MLSLFQPKSVIRPTFISFLVFSGLFMPYQHFFMFHDVTWARQSKRAFSALAVARYALTSLTLLWLGKASELSLLSLYATFTSDEAILLETNTNLA